MGIRIKKQIGYFLNNKEVKNLFIKDYVQVIEDLDIQDEKEKDFFLSLFEMMKNSVNSRGEKDFFMAGYLLNEYEKAVKENTLKAYKLISKMLSCDDVKGVFICSMEQCAVSRYDDLIDYYENSMQDKIKKINRPIYPLTGYIYQGGLEKSYPNLIKGQKVDASLAWKAVNFKNVKEGENYQKYFYEIIKGGYFTPVIDPIVFMIATAAKLLKPGVTKEEFNAIVKPVIATTWS